MKISLYFYLQIRCWPHYKSFMCESPKVRVCGTFVRKPYAAIEAGNYRIIRLSARETDAKRPKCSWKLRSTDQVAAFDEPAGRRICCCGVHMCCGAVRVQSVEICHWMLLLK